MGLWQWFADRLGATGHRRNEAALHPGIEAVTRAPLPASSQLLIAAICGLFAFLLLWASLSSVEIVSRARGKIVPSSDIRLVQAPQLSRIDRILVEEGAHVDKGDPLIRLEDAEVRSEWRQARERVQRLEARRRRLEALVEAARGGAQPGSAVDADTRAGADDARSSSPPSYASGRAGNARLIEAERLEAAAMRDQWSSYSAQLASLERRVAEKEAAVKRIEAELVRLEALLPFSRERVARYERLAAGGNVAREKLDEARRQLVERRSRLDVVAQELAEARAARERAVQEVRAHREAFISEHSLKLAEVDDRLSAARERLRRKESMLARYELTAPIAGTVMEVAASRRAVVEPAETLMRVVPEDAPLEAEVRVLNKDIGFVDPGQKVDVKVDTFEFTKYGAISGRITSIANDAVEHEELGLVYPAKVELARDTLDIGERRASLSPGMTVVADIQVGSRRLIEYLLTPVLRYREEAMRER